MISLTIKAVREATCRLLRVLRQFVRRQLLTNAGGGACARTFTHEAKVLHGIESIP